MMKIERSVGEQRRLDQYGNCESARIGYVVSNVGKDAFDAALRAVFEAAPDQVEGIPKKSAEILRSPGGGMLEIGVEYRNASKKSYNGRSAGERTWKIDVAGRSQPLKRALKCLSSKSLINGIPAPDPGCRLEWNGIPGVRAGNAPVYILEPEMVLSCVATFRNRKLNTRGYLRQIAETVGKVNSTAFHGWNAGELLFSGLNTGTPFEGRNGEELCNVTFRFNVRCNEIHYVDGVSAGMVEGWDYLWTLPSANPNHNGSGSVHISRIYERCSFAVLDI